MECSLFYNMSDRLYGLKYKECYVEYMTIFSTYIYSMYGNEFNCFIYAIYGTYV